MDHRIENVPGPQNETKSAIQKRWTMVIVALFLAIASIALVVSIVLVFTIGRKPNVDYNSSTSNTITAISSSISILTATTTTAPLLLTDALAEPCTCGCPTIQPEFSVLRVVNGETAKENSWPWQLLLIVYASNGIWSSYCGASLISDRHVLTAAHCVFGHSSRFVYIFAGQHALNLDVSPSSGFATAAIHVHESYDQVSLRHDIAIVTLKAPLRFDAYTSPACLAKPASPGSVLQLNDTLIATGWGRLSGEPDSTSRPSHLQQIKLAYVPVTHPLCIAAVGTEPSSGQICAGFPPKNICYGDSGGPLVRQQRFGLANQTYWQQVGIVSLTWRCGYNSSYPDVFVDVQSYSTWIVDKMRY